MRISKVGTSIAVAFVAAVTGAMTVSRLATAGGEVRVEVAPQLARRIVRDVEQRHLRPRDGDPGDGRRAGQDGGGDQALACC